METRKARSASGKRKELKPLAMVLAPDVGADRAALLRPGYRLGRGWLIQVQVDRFNRIFRRCCVCGEWYRIDPSAGTLGKPFGVRMHCGSVECRARYVARQDFGLWFDPDCIGPGRSVCVGCGRPDLDDGLYVIG